MLRHRSIGLLVAIMMATVGIAVAQSATLQDEDIRDKTVEGKVIQGSTIARATILSSTIRDSQVANAVVDRATVERSTLRDTLVTNATVRDSTVEGTTLRGITIESSRLSKVLVEKALMTGGSLTDATVRDSTLDNVERTRVSLCNVLLRDEGRTDTSGCSAAPPTGGGGQTPPRPPTSPTPPPGGGSGSRTVFALDARTVAAFEFDGTTADASGNGRNPSMDGPVRFAPSRFGQALLVGTDGPSVDWSNDAGSLTHPFSIEMVVTPDTTTGYRKLFGFDGSKDAGWYIYNSGLTFYGGGATLAEGRITPNVQHYLAFVSTGPDSLDVYVDGNLVGSSAMTFTAPPGDAIFFRDDNKGGEQFTGTVDALRISNTARTAGEIASVQARVAG